MTWFSFWLFVPLGSASVVLVVYNHMREVLNGSFFKTRPSETANVISNVISVVLPNNANNALQTPVNLTIQHLKVGFNFIIFFSVKQILMVFYYDWFEATVNRMQPFIKYYFLNSIFFFTTFRSVFCLCCIAKLATNQLKEMCLCSKRTSTKEKPACVYWKVSAWVVDGCHVSTTTATNTVCSCEHLSTFALIMTVNHNLEVTNFILQLVKLYVFYCLANHYI